MRKITRCFMLLGLIVWSLYVFHGAFKTHSSEFARGSEMQLGTSRPVTEEMYQHAVAEARDSVAQEDASTGFQYDQNKPRDGVTQEQKKPRLEEFKPTHCPVIDYKTDTLINGVWPVIPHANGLNITIFRAYYDDRRANNPVIQIFVSAPFREWAWTFLHNLLCEIVYNDTSTEISTPRVRQLPGFSYIVGKVRYGPMHITYNASSKFPCHVRLWAEDTVTPKCEFPVTFPYVSDGRDRIGLCVPMLYGNLDDREARALVEWFETNLILGVSEINMYNTSLMYSALVNRVLEYYVELGVLQLSEFPSPFSHWESSEIFEATGLCVIPNINDCMLRNMHRYSAVLALDFDEIFVPSKYWTYNDVLNNATSENPNCTCLKFETANVFLDFHEDEVLRRKNTTTQYMNSSYITEKFRYMIPGPKGITKPFAFTKSCYILFNHWCIKMPGTTQKINPPGGLVYHFRRECATGHKMNISEDGTVTHVEKRESKNPLINCSKFYEEFVESSTLTSDLLDHFPTIRERTSHVIQLLNLTFAPHY